MLELVRSAASLFSLPQPSPHRQGLVVGLAQHPHEVRALQKLRYRVFTAEYAPQRGVSQNQSSGLKHVNADAVNLDQDRFDAFCDHLMVKDLATDQVVGTYRVLKPEQARRAGGYYAESEFDLSALDSIRPHLVEFGRACIDEPFRGGGVLMMLWSGLAAILKQGGYEHVLGCASVSLRDDGVTAAHVWRQVKDTLQAPLVKPHHRYPVDQLNHLLPAQTPALLAGYMKLGARISGEPAWDPDFNSADFPMLLSVSQMGARYRRHFGLDEHSLKTKTDARPFSLFVT